MGDDQALEAAAGALRSARRVAVLSGAGISAESGVPTFRDSDGLWEGHRIEDVATPFGFERDPGLVWKFYNARRANAKQVRPNPGHYALAAMERKWGDAFCVITQNVDGLHRAAGNQRVYEIHGSLRRTRCTYCAEIVDRGVEPLAEMPKCESCGGLLRPDIVWFHEMLPPEIWERSAEAASDCDVLLVVGTSAVVYPAASIIPIARNSNAKVIEFNLKETEASSQVDIGLYGPAGVMLPRLCTLLELAIPEVSGT